LGYALLRYQCQGPFVPPSRITCSSCLSPYQHADDFDCHRVSTYLWLLLDFGRDWVAALLRYRCQEILTAPAAKGRLPIVHLLICPCALPRRSVAKACALRLSRCPGSTIDSPLQTRRCRETTNWRLVLLAIYTDAGQLKVHILRTVGKGFSRRNLLLSLQRGRVQFELFETICRTLRVMLCNSGFTLACA
jgi:hypothetical protein